MTTNLVSKANIVMGQEKDLKLKCCAPTTFPLLLEVTNEKVTGFFASYATPFIEIVEKVFNATIIIQHKDIGLGDRIGDSDLYDGCLGKLQRGETDAIGQAVDYPLDIANVSQGFIVLDERVTFSGVYARPDSVKAADFARSIYAFEWPIYLLIFFYLLLFAVFFKVRSYMRMRMQKSIMIVRGKSLYKGVVREQLRRIERRFKKSPGFSDIVRHFAQTNFIEEDSYFVAVITTVLTLFSFLIFTYFNNLLNTDLVIPNKAKMYENYDELMENNVQPLFLKGLSYYKDLKNAKEGSKGNIFWNWAVKKFGEKNLFADITVNALQDHIVDAMTGQKVIFTGEILSMTYRSSVCDMFDRDYERLALVMSNLDERPLDYHQFKDLQVYSRNDDSAPNMIKSLVVSNKLIHSKKYVSAGYKLFFNFFEAGLNQAHIRIAARANVADAFPNVNSVLGKPVFERLEVKYTCKENIPVPKPAKIDRLTLINFKLSFYACIFLLICAFLLLAIENVLHR